MTSAITFTEPRHISRPAVPYLHDHELAFGTLGQPSTGVKWLGLPMLCDKHLIRSVATRIHSTVGHDGCPVILLSAQDRLDVEHGSTDHLS